MTGGIVLFFYSVPRGLSEVYTYCTAYDQEGVGTLYISTSQGTVSKFEGSSTYLGTNLPLSE